MKSWIAGLLDELKRRHDMSGRELAIAIGVNRNSVFDWLKGKETPNLESKRKIAKFCGCSLEGVEQLERGRITVAQFLAGEKAAALVEPKEVKRSAPNYSVKELLELTSFFSALALEKSTVSLMEKSEDCPTIQDNEAGLFFSPGARSMHELEVLRELVRERIAELGISEAEFARRCLLGLKVFRQVMNGEDVPNLDTKLGNIASQLVNPETQEPFADADELVMYCQQKSPQHCEEGDDCCVRNGLH